MCVWQTHAAIEGDLSGKMLKRLRKVDENTLTDRWDSQSGSSASLRSPTAARYPNPPGVKIGMEEGGETPDKICKNEFSLKSDRLKVSSLWSSCFHTLPRLDKHRPVFSYPLCFSFFLPLSVPGAAEWGDTPLVSVVSGPAPIPKRRLRGPSEKNPGPTQRAGMLASGWVVLPFRVNKTITFSVFLPYK